MLAKPCPSAQLDWLKGHDSRALVTRLVFCANGAFEAIRQIIQRETPKDFAILRTGLIQYFALQIPGQGVYHVEAGRTSRLTFAFHAESSPLHFRSANTKIRSRTSCMQSNASPISNEGGQIKEIPRADSTNQVTPVNLLNIGCCMLPTAFVDSRQNNSAREEIRASALQQPDSRPTKQLQAAFSCIVPSKPIFGQTSALSN